MTVDSVGSEQIHPRPAGHRGRSNRSRHRINLQSWAELVEPITVGPDDVAQWAPQIVDSGFGTGESVLALAREQPQSRVLAVETYETGVLRVARELAVVGATNVRVSNLDIRDVLPHIGLDSLEEFRVFFPDPWPKRKHASRRLVNAEFLADVTDRLRVGGVLWFATDVPDYAESVVEIAGDQPRLVRETQPPVPRPATKYESIAGKAGRTCRDFVWRRVS